MDVAFSKMHGAGNDFVVLDERERRVALPVKRIAELADRRRGIGFDQLIRLRAPSRDGALVRIEIVNADGSDAGACGNATRCVASLVLGGRPGEVGVETAAGVLGCRVLGSALVEVDMGAPAFDAASIGIGDETVDTLLLPIEGQPAGCSMGNPHATFFVPALDTVDVETVGPLVERDALFRDRANVGFAQVMPAGVIRLRVWERGAGLTLACGSGACAAVVNASRRGLAGRAASVVLDGGVLEIEWRETDGHVLMTGPVATSFSGSFAA